jgi:hypothetical protein
VRFILFVEGHTERKALPAFLKRWLDPELGEPVGFRIVWFEGSAELWKECPKRARMYLNDPTGAGDVIGVISLLDLYGLPRYTADASDTDRRYAWAKAYMEKQVDDPRFRQFFAVHETEAWLLSDPTIFQADMRKTLAGRPPEKVNFDEPPAKLLDRLYLQQTKRHYEKVVHGRQLFAKLDPYIARDKCPYLKCLLDDMLDMATRAGLQRS